MPVKTPRKKDSEIPKLDGWTFHEMKTNLYTPCEDCGVKASEFFYQHYRPEPEAGILKTRVKCQSCVMAFPGEGKQG
jgi:hypothetical protein